MELGVVMLSKIIQSEKRQISHVLSHMRNLALKKTGAGITQFKKGEDCLGEGEGQRRE
jgi:hypothetical protein